MSAYVYLLHFDEKYPGGQNPQHYLGVAADLRKRMEEHHRGSSKSRLTRACVEKGIGMRVARVWTKPYPKAAFDFERAVKARKTSYAVLCPLCRGKPALVPTNISDAGIRLRLVHEDGDSAQFERVPIRS